MSISIRSHASAVAPSGGHSSQAVTISGVQTGDTLVALIYGGGRDVQSVSDNQNNIWTQVPNAKIAFTCDIWMVTSANPGSTTVTVTLTGSTVNLGIALYDLSATEQSAIAATAASSSTPTSFNGPALSIGTPGVYLALLVPPTVSGENSANVGSPWSLDESMANPGGFGTNIAVSLQGHSGSQQPIFGNLTATANAINSTGIALSDIVSTAGGGTPPDVFDPAHVNTPPQINYPQKAMLQPRRVTPQPSPLKPWYAGRPGGR